jgi:hypothetical protein
MKEGGEGERRLRARGGSEREEREERRETREKERVER